ncbi:hypothetical protein ACOMHN_048121 [Nucella lapillus]
MDKIPPTAARLTLKRLLWLILAGGALYLTNSAYHGTVFRGPPLPTSTQTPVLEEKVMDKTSRFQNSVRTERTPQKQTGKISSKMKTESRQVLGAGKKTSLLDSHAARNTTRGHVSDVDKLTAAAARIRAVFLPPTFPFSNDVYFHPPETGPVRNLSHILITPADACSGDRGSSPSSPFLVVLVLSSYLQQAARERAAIRATYGSVASGGGGRWPKGKPLAAPVTMLFLLGTPPSPTHRQLVQTESARYGDMLVADFVDSYQNLTLKVLHGLRWVLHNCPQAKFVLKADDDVFVNLPLLTAFLSKRGQKNSIYGHGYFGSVVSRKGRWAVPSSVYPVPRYPVYMSGTAYVMSRDAAQKIVEASHRIPLVLVEDAFITGILAQITGVRRVTCVGFTHFAEGRPGVCDFVNDHRIVGNKMYAADKTGLWAVLKNDYLLQNCVE